MRQCSDVDGGVVEEAAKLGQLVALDKRLIALDVDDHVGIGGEYGGSTLMPSDLNDVSTYPALFAELEARGWSRHELDRLRHERLVGHRDR